MRYEIATLTLGLGTAAKAVAGIDAWVKDSAAKGTLLGCWMSEVGQLNQVSVFRSFADQAELEAERHRALTSTNPFNAGEAIKEMDFDSYLPFPFCPPVTPGKFGPVYEIRTYRLKHGGLQPTIAAWEAAVPERVKISPMIIAMSSIDGPSRITHIWAYPGHDARIAARAESVAKGVWPPKGGPDWLTGDMRSTVALPTAISPLT